MPTTYQIITDRIIKALEGNRIPWRQPWSTKAGLNDQQNLITQHQYRGINMFITASSGFDQPYWLTFKQAQEIGANVKRGEKGTPIVYWLRCSKEDKKTEDVKSFMVPRFYTVFNIAQIEGVDLSKFLKRPEAKEAWKQVESCERIVGGYENRPEIRHVQQRAFYRMADDHVNMPRRETFKSEQHYYAVLFHELTHSTGHPRRLSRDLSNVFGSHEYSKEELVAELGAAFLCSAAGIDSPELEEQATAYIQSWIKVLRNDTKLLIQAAAQAQKATDLILNVKHESAGAEPASVSPEAVA